jgi:hypothetical protein
LVVGGTHVIVPEIADSNDKVLDGDMILAAQTMMLSASDAVIVTVGHLSCFAPAAVWQNITIG